MDGATRPERSSLLIPCRTRRAPLIFSPGSAHRRSPSTLATAIIMSTPRASGGGVRSSSPLHFPTSSVGGTPRASAIRREANGGEWFALFLASNNNNKVKLTMSSARLFIAAPLPNIVTACGGVRKTCSVLISGARPALRHPAVLPRLRRFDPPSPTSWRHSFIVPDVISFYGQIRRPQRCSPGSVIPGSWSRFGGRHSPRHIGRCHVGGRRSDWRGEWR